MRVWVVYCTAWKKEVVVSTKINFDNYDDLEEYANNPDFDYYWGM